MHSLRHSKLVPLGLKREDCALHSLSPSVEVDMEEGEDGILESEDEEEEDFTEYLDDDSEMFDGFVLEVWQTVIDLQ